MSGWNGLKKKKEKIPHPHRDILIITILSVDF